MENYRKAVEGARPAGDVTGLPASASEAVLHEGEAARWLTRYADALREQGAATREQTEEFRRLNSSIAGLIESQRGSEQALREERERVIADAGRRLNDVAEKVSRAADGVNAASLNAKKDAHDYAGLCARKYLESMGDAIGEERARVGEALEAYRAEFEKLKLATGKALIALGVALLVAVVAAVVLTLVTVGAIPALNSLAAEHGAPMLFIVWVGSLIIAAAAARKRA